MPRVVAIHYTLTDKDGETIDTSSGDEPLSYLEGSGQIIPGLEDALKAAKKGDKKVVKVPAAQAYGEHDEEKIVQVPREQLPEGKIQVGDRFQTDHNMVFQVIEMDDKTVTLDGNHPLAGQDLNFDVEVMEIREATAEEMAHGHAHGPHGHEH